MMVTRRRPRRTPSRRQIAAALVSSVRVGGSRDDLAAFVTSFGLDAILAAAGHHGVEGSVTLALVEADAVVGPSRVNHATAAAHLRSCATLVDVGVVLDAAGVAWASFKGPVLAGHYYPRPDLRTYVDVDVLVHPTDFARALESLEGVGFAVYERNWRLLAAAMPSQLRLMTPSGSVVDLHWHVVNDRALRETTRLSAADLLARRGTVSVAGQDIPTFDPEDTLVHVALHAALSGAARLQWLLDIYYVVAKDALDWSVVIERAERARISWSVGSTLSRAQRSLGAAIPATVLRRLGPRGPWSLLVRAANQRAGVGVARTDASFLRLVTRATREGTWASAAQLTSATTSWWATGRRRAGLAPESMFDQLDEDSVLFAAGDRAVYLAAVGEETGSAASS